MSVIKVRIADWGDYNPKRDQKTYTWLRLDNQFYEAKSLFKFKPEEKYIWVVLLCFASRKNSAEVTIDTEHFAHYSVCDCNLVQNVFVKLAEAKLIEIITTAHDRALPHTTPTKERKNERTAPKTVVFDFDKIYSVYPRKEGKSSGMKKLKSVIKTENDLNRFKVSVDNFVKLCKERNTEKKYIPMFSTFVNSKWEDYETIESPSDDMDEFISGFEDSLDKEMESYSGKKDSERECFFKRTIDAGNEGGVAKDPLPVTV